MTNGGHLVMVKHLDHRLHQRGAVYSPAREHDIADVVLQPRKTDSYMSQCQNSSNFECVKKIKSN